MYATYEDATSVHIVMDTCEMTLMKYLEQATSKKGEARSKEPQEPLVSNLIGQMVAGLVLMHRTGIAHRDIKPDNIMVNAPKSPGGPCEVRQASVNKIPDVDMYLCSLLLI